MFSYEKIRLLYQVYMNVYFILIFSIAENTWRVSLIRENEYNFDFGHVSIDFFFLFLLLKSRLLLADIIIETEGKAFYRFVNNDNYPILF